MRLTTLLIIAVFLCLSFSYASGVAPKVETSSNVETILNAETGPSIETNPNVEAPSEVEITSNVDTISNVETGSSVRTTSSIETTPNVETGKKIVLLISEQNIGGPQQSWWASEIDLSATEAIISQRIIDSGYQIIEPSELSNVIKQDKGFRMVDLSDEQSVKLGSLSNADYIILGKAIASSGGNVPQSTMISCFANITAKLIRVQDHKVIAYLDATGSSAHMDVITGGREALVIAAGNLSEKLLNTLRSE